MLDPRIPFHADAVVDNLSELGSLRRRLIAAMKGLVDIKFETITNETTSPADCTDGVPVNNSSDSTFFLVYANTASVAPMLPDARLFPRLVYFFKKMDPSAFPVILTPFPGQTIDDQPTDTIDQQYDVTGIGSTGENWVKILPEGGGGGGGGGIGALGVTFDAGGEVIGVGKQADLYIPFDCSILGVAMLAHEVGSIAVDVWKIPYAGFAPTVADAITGSAVPTISASNKSLDLTLSGWTTAILDGDTLRFTVLGVASITQLTIELIVDKS